MSCPEPGIYYDVPFADYSRWSAMNGSTLCEGLLSMLRLKAAIDGELDRGDTPAMRFGRAVHCRLLEPDKYPTAFPVAERCCATLKPKRKGDEPGQCSHTGRYMAPNGWVCGQHATEQDYEPPDFLMPEEAERVEKIRRNALGDKEAGVRGHEDVMWMAGRGHSEVSIVFDLSGVRCKARLDKWIPDNSLIVDLKTISRPFSERVWLNTVLDLHYHIKAAMYIEAAKSLGHERPAFAWVFVETSPPYDVAVIALAPDVESAGREDLLMLLSSYKSCLESGEWPGQYPRMVSHFTLPAWKLREYEGQEIG